MTEVKQAAATEEGVRLKVTTFNMLANCWVNPKWYPGIPAELLDHEKRLAIMLREMKTWNSDIYCLQEVEESVSKRLAKEFGEEYTLSPLSCNTPTSAPVPNGTLIMCRKTLGKLMQFYEIIWTTEEGDAGTVGWVRLTKTDCLIGIISCHLDFQAASEQFSKVLHTISRGTTGHEQFICCGDMNIKASSLQVQAAVSAKPLGLREAFDWKDLPYSYYSATQPPNRIDSIIYKGDRLKIEKTEEPMTSKYLASLPSGRAAQICATNLRTYGSDHAPLHATFIVLP